MKEKIMWVLTWTAWVLFDLFFASMGALLLFVQRNETRADKGLVIGAMTCFYASALISGLLYCAYLENRPMR